MREGLQGFSEAHVIGENAVKTVVGEKLQPAEAIDLIMAEIRLDGGRHLGGRQTFDVAQIAAELGKRAGGFRAFDGERVGHAGGAETIEAQRTTAAILAVEQVADLIDHIEETLGGKTDVAIGRIITGKSQGFRDALRIFVTLVPVLGDRAGNLRNQAHPLAAELSRDIEAEPVDAMVRIRLDGGKEVGEIVDGEPELGIAPDDPAGGLDGFTLVTC